MIRFENVSKKYGDHFVIEGLDLTVNRGEFLVLVGPSGCGKTTTLKMINRLIPLTTGTIFINNKRVSDYNINELRWNIGYVLQQIALFPHLSIEDNIAIVPELKKWKQKQVKERIKELLLLVGLDYEDYRKRMPSELSGGQQQRIGVIRALAADPDILLMDEPFSALDPISREKLQNELIHIQKKIKKTIVFVTHDMQEALKMADRICLLNDGKIVQIDTPENIIHKPKNAFVKSFIKQLLCVDDLLEENDHTERIEFRYEANLEELLRLFIENDAVNVVRGDEVVGIITRDAAYSQIVSRLESVGG